MTIYILNILLIGLYSLIYNLRFKNNNKVKTILISLSVLQLIAMLTFRNIWLGSDMPHYWGYYQEQFPWGLGSLTDIRFEIGFKIITKFITSFTENNQIYLMAIAAISTIPVGYIASKYSKMPFLTILLYVFLGFFAFTFSGLRQAMAMGLILLSYKYLRDSKIFKFFIMVGLAVSFHYSAIVFLPMYFLRKISLNNRGLVILGVLASSILIFKAQIFTAITSLFYLNYAIVATDSYNWTLMSFAIVIFCIVFYNRVVKVDDKNKLLYTLVLIGALAMLFSSVTDNVMRVANYFFIFIILLLPEVINTIKKNRTRISVAVLVLLCSLGIYTYLMQIDGYHITPYSFYWQSTGVIN